MTENRSFEPVACKGDQREPHQPCDERLRADLSWDDKRISKHTDHETVWDEKPVTTGGDKLIGVTLLVKSRASDSQMDDTIKEIAERKRYPLDDAEFENRFGADKASMDKVKLFAKEHGLSISEADMRSGKVYVRGPAEQLGKVFGVEIGESSPGSGPRNGVIKIPPELQGSVEGVFGLEKERKIVPHLSRLEELQDKIKKSGRFAYYPDEVGEFYNFPKGTTGAGQSVGIILLGGGINLEDNAKYYKEHAWKVPDIQVVGVDGGRNDEAHPDDEVALDSQIIGVLAPDAKQQLIFAENTDQAFIDSITRATFPEPGETQNSVISISFGAPESTWAPQTIHAMNRALKVAALKGVSVFIASGDNGALDRSKDGRFNTDFPASSPWATGIGATRIYVDRGEEVVWNEGPGATAGGGVSEAFPLPDFQKDAKVPLNANGTGRTGRGVPDLSANGANNSGYMIRYDGHETSRGGTSAAAPLYSALTLRVNESLGQRAGYLNPFLYGKASANVFRDVISGHNGGYRAGVGWDAASGLGSVDGTQFLEELKTDMQKRR